MTVAVAHLAIAQMEWWNKLRLTCLRRNNDIRSYCSLSLARLSAKSFEPQPVRVLPVSREQIRSFYVDCHWPGCIVEHTERSMTIVLPVIPVWRSDVPTRRYPVVSCMSRMFARLRGTRRGIYDSSTTFVWWCGTRWYCTMPTRYVQNVFSVDDIVTHILWLAVSRAVLFILAQWHILKA